MGVQDENNIQRNFIQCEKLQNTNVKNKTDHDPKQIPDMKSFHNVQNHDGIRATTKENANGTKHKICHKEKVQKLIETIKMKQKEKMQSDASVGSSDQNSNYSLNFKSLRPNGASFRNRFHAQKNIIEMQKLRLQEQEKIINELRLGILTEEVRDTLDKNKCEIRDLFSDCKPKLIGKVSLDYVPVKEREKFSLNTQNAPKIIQELEQRAFERHKYREMIKQRKKILEETKKRMQEEALEQKKCLEEAEKRRLLEVMKERRKEEVEKMKIRQMNKERFERNFKKATEFYNRKLIFRTFNAWKFVYGKSLDNAEMSENHYRMKTVGKCFKVLLHFVEVKYTLKYNVADRIYSTKLMRTVLNCLQKNRIESIRSMQVAEDYHDFLIQRNVMKYWSRYVYKEKILSDIKMEQAIRHNREKLLFQSFFRWKSLPTVLKLEKVKEERKQKWRQKVWEILPDFSPSEI